MMNRTVVVLAAGVTAALAAVSACTDSFSSCKETRTCRPPASSGAGGEAPGEEGGAAGITDNAGASQMGGESSTGFGGEQQAEGGEAPQGAAGAGASTATTIVHVLDRQDRHPVKGATVLVHSNDGTILTQATTDAQGTAAVEVTEGVGVTAALIKDYVLDSTPKQARSLSSALDLPLGGSVTLLIEDPPLVGFTPEPLVADITVTVNTNVAGTHSHVIGVSCRPQYTGPESTFTFEDYRGCPGETNYNVYALVTVAGKPQAFGASYFVPFQSDTPNSVVVTANDTSLVTYKLTATDVPAGSESISFAAEIRRNTGSAVDFQDSDYVQLPDATQVLAAVLPSGNFSRYGSSANLRVASQPFYLDVGFSRTAQNIPPAQTWAASLDVALFKSSLQLTKSTARLAWALEDKGNLGDAVWAEVSWGAWPDETKWWVVTPPTRSGTFALPDLPDEMAAIKPSEHDVFNTTIRHADLLGLDGYEQYLSEGREAGPDGVSWSQLGDYH